MKKIIIVNNNMKVGGVQKSLYNLLWSLEGRYDVTLLLFRAVGEYADKLPPDVKLLECGSLFRYLGISQGECHTLRDKLTRGALAAVARVFGRDAAMKPVLASQKTLPETYDCAISFLHNGRRESFYGGVQDFVLNRISAKRKIAFLHCDYGRCGADHRENNRMMARFDIIAACSDGCGKSFTDCLPELSSRCVTVRNCHRMEEILTLSRQDPRSYDPQDLNILMVSRLTREKAIHRGITALKYALDRNIPARLHIVGGGPLEQTLRDTAREMGVGERVHFYGEQDNPYRYMKNADLFLMTSHHEAAPMVIEEARCLGLPVLTAETTSSHEMVTAPGCGWVCENTQDALNETLAAVLQNREALRSLRETLRRTPMDNTEALTQFHNLIL